MMYVAGVARCVGCSAIVPYMLDAQDSEAARRSAVSRAYYGAFHLCRRLVVNCGVSLPSGPECHTKLRYCLAASEQELQQSASILDWLRVERNKADYDLGNPSSSPRPDGRGFQGS